MSKKLLLIVFAFAAFSVFSQTPKPSPQTSPSPSPTPVSLETILTEAEKQTARYKENFSNLLAEEIKTFETYDKNGEVRETRRVESNFLVYQSAKNPAIVVEYRNVTKVDGIAVSDSEKRAEVFFNEVLKSDSAKTELEKIQKESSRYDKNLEIRGLTLNQSPILVEHIRRAFDFKITGEENYGARRVYVIDYMQKTRSPYIVFDDSQPDKQPYLSYQLDLPKSLRDLQLLVRGTLRIDKETFQVLQERREVVLPTNTQSQPVIIMEMTFEYQISELGLLTPKRITLTDNNVRVRDKGNDYSVVKDNQATFEYTKFTRSDVEVKSGDVDSSKIKNN